MNETRSRYWFSILSYTVVCIVFLGLLYFVAETFFPKTSSELVPRNDALSARFVSDFRWGRGDQDAHNEPLSNPLKEKIKLVLDRGIRIGNSKIVYRGMDDNAKLNIDVVRLQLDPNAFYRYRIPIKAAKKGFRLVDQNFKLISARKSVVQLRRLKN